MNVMKKRVAIICALLVCAVGANAQSIWDAAHLKAVREAVDQPAYSTARRALLRRADAELTREPLSVMMKEKTPASGDKHDYMSQARYFWPDPKQPDGLPYIQRDGESNPELEKLDRVRLGAFAGRVTTLSLAWYFSGEEKYARKAAELIRVWFFDKATRMNPNLNYAQVVPGRFDDRGRCYGVIDTYSFVEMLDAVQLLEQSEAFTARDSRQLKAWFSQLLDWILTSEQGREESSQKNNHAVAHDAQVIAFAMYADRRDVAERVVREFPERRIYTQIEPDGSQPEELRRTLAFGYSQFNLHHFLDIFTMGRKLGISIDNSTSPDGRNFYKAVDFLTPYLGKELSQWPYEQISDWEGKQQELAADLYRIYLLNPSRTDYLRLYLTHVERNPADRFNLLYLRADVADHALAFADGQLKFAIERTAEARRRATNKALVSPRTVEKDGSLRLVAPRDWCSGFFAGSLWQMYAYNHDGEWRQQAVSHTWPIEEVKMHRGSHDLGFMIYNTFGQAYRLTGERSYRDVALQAARTLITRYRPSVGAIRSWDHNRQLWDYPVIIDNMMNLELLFWATQETGDPIYRKIAIDHANTTMRNHFRDDHSSYHVVSYDTITGRPAKRQTHQGYADESVWSRGQAWGLYGYTMCYRFTKDPAYLQQAERIAAFFFGQPNLPADLVPYWDMSDPAIPSSPRDASAAAIFASGLYELATYAAAPMNETYRRWADTIVENLTAHYRAEPGTEQGFLLLHSTGHYPGKDEIDVPIAYADYYYLEALLRRIGVTNY